MIDGTLPEKKRIETITVLNNGFAGVESDRQEEAHKYMNEQMLLQSIDVLHESIISLIDECKHTPCQMIRQAIQKIIYESLIDENALRSILSRCSLIHEDILYKDVSCDVLTLNTMGLTNEQLTTLYYTLHEECKMVKIVWVQCDICEKWRRLAPFHNLNKDAPWYCSMLDGFNCATDEDKMLSDEVCLYL